MKSRVGDEVREAQEREILAMTPEERVALALRLGERELTRYAEMHGVTRDEARRILQRNARAGRRYSRCLEELDGDASR